MTQEPRGENSAAPPTETERAPPRPASRPRASFIGWRLAIGLLIVYLGAALLGLALQIPTHHDLTYPEGAVVARMMDVAAGRTPYTDWREWPHAFAPYGPLTYYPPGWLGRALSIEDDVTRAYILGRVHSFVFLAGIWALVIAIARRLSFSWPAALGAVALFAWWRYVQEFVVSFRPDAPQVFFALAALWIALGGRATGRRILASLLLLMFAFWYKPSSWGITLALALWAADGLGKLKAGTAWAVFALVGLAGALLLNTLLDGALMLNMLGVTDVGWEPFRFFAYLAEVPVVSLAALLFGALLAVAALRTAPAESSLRWLAIAFLLSFGLTIVQFAKNGAYWNYFLAPYALACLMAGWGLDEGIRRFGARREGRAALALLFAGLLLATGLTLRGLQDGVGRVRLLSKDLPGTEALLQKQPRSVLSYYPWFSLTLGAEAALLDSYQLSLLAERDAELARPLLERMERAEFDLILIPGLYLDQRAFYPPEFFELLESRYVQTGTLGANAVFEAGKESVHD